MANLLNNPSCGSSGGATGKPSCAVDPKIIVGLILTDTSKTFSAADLADFQTVLGSATVADGKERIHPIFRFVEFTDNSENPTVQTLGYGSKSIVKEGKNDWTFRFQKGAMCLLKNIRKFNNADVKVLFVDEENVIYGVQTDDGGLMGFSTDFVYGHPFKLTDGSKDNEYKIQVVQSKPEEWDNLGAYYADFDVEENVKGLIELALIEIDVTSNFATIEIDTACDMANVYDDFGSDFADPTVWTVTKVSDGSNVSVATAISQEAGKNYKLGFTATGDVTISLVTPNRLALKGIGGAPANGYISTVLTVTMP
jgi:hypothetical protein